MAYPSLPSVLKDFLTKTTIGQVAATNIDAICQCLRSRCNKTQRTYFREKYNKLKRSMHPVSCNVDVRAQQALYTAASASSAAKVEASRALAAAIRVASTSEDVRDHAKTFGTFDREFVDIWEIDASSGYSNRARRSVKASHVFSKHAGLTKIPGARIDRYGNAVGDVGDLVPDNRPTLVLCWRPFA